MTFLCALLLWRVWPSFCRCPCSIPLASLAGFKFYLTLWSRDGGAGMVEQGWRRVLEPYRRFLSVESSEPGPFRPQIPNWENLSLSWILWLPFDNFFPTAAKYPSVVTPPHTHHRSEQGRYTHTYVYTYVTHIAQETFCACSLSSLFKKKIYNLLFF